MGTTSELEAVPRTCAREDAPTLATPTLAAPASFGDGDAGGRSHLVALPGPNAVDVPLPVSVPHMTRSPPNPVASQAEAQARMVREAAASHAQRAAQAHAHRAMQAAQEAAAAVVARIDTMGRQNAAAAPHGHGDIIAQVEVPSDGMHRHPALHQQEQSSASAQNGHNATAAHLAAAEVVSVSGAHLGGIASEASGVRPHETPQESHTQPQAPSAAQLPHRPVAAADSVVGLFSAAPSGPARRRRRSFVTEEERKQARIMKNRRTAEESRQRRVRKMADLEVEAKTNREREAAMAAETERLKSEVAVLKAENTALKAEKASRQVADTVGNSDAGGGELQAEVEVKLRNEITKLKSALYDKGELISDLKKKISQFGASAAPKEI